MFNRTLHVTLILLIALAVPLASGKAAPPPPEVGTAVALAPVGHVPNYSGCGGLTGAPTGSASYEQRVVELVNAERAKLGLPPLKHVAVLDEAARYHSVDMHDDNYFQHDTYDRSGGGVTRVCEWINRLDSYYGNRAYAGENIAYGLTSPEGVIVAWMNSASHRANILNANFWEIGVGFYRNYWTQDFGNRFGVYPVIINREAAETDDYKVDLYLYGNDVWGKPQWEEMRIRNAGGAWTAWMPFQANVTDWELPRVVGRHTVEVEMRAGNETTLSQDEILLTYVATPVMSVPDKLVFLYSIPESRLQPASYTVVPQNRGTPDALTWEVAHAGGWFTVSPGGGTTPGGFTVTPTTFDAGGTIVHAGMITVTATAPADTQNSPAQIEVYVYVFNAPIRQIFLPVIRR